MASSGNQHEHDDSRHGSQGQQLDSGLDAYAHSADQSMGYLETEQQGQTEVFGDEPFGPYEHGGAMNADSDRYTPTHSPDQTRLPDDSGQPDAGPWAAQPPGSQPPGAGDQAMPAEYAAWNPPAASGPGASTNPGQLTADELRERERERDDTGQANPTPIPEVDTDAPTPNEAQRSHGAPLGPVPSTGKNAGGDEGAEQVLQRDTQRMKPQNERTTPSGGRAQPTGTVKPTDKHAEALLDARTRIQDAIDQLASQIPYGEEFAAQAKEATDTALDRMEAQALGREAELQRDLSATP